VPTISTSRHLLEVDQGEVEIHLASRSSSTSSTRPALVIAHGFPSGVSTAETVGRDHHLLADRVCNESRWTAASVRLRGCGESKGQFSLAAWYRDLAAATDFIVAESGSKMVFLAGFGTGGALSICVGADDPRVVGVAAIAAPSDFDDWARSPDLLVAHARTAGAITDPDHPADLDAFAEELNTYRAIDRAEDMADRSLLVLHGSLDEVVAPLDARAVADRHGAADLRIIVGANHGLRHDPRAIAVLLGWLETKGGSH